MGQLRLREKHLTGQQLTVSGSVVLTVLYTSEESTGLRSLSMEVPFSCQVEDKRLMGCTAVCVAGRLLLAEAWAVTARKLYLRVMPEFTVSGYANRRQRLCCGVGEGPALRVRRQETELELLTAVEEREFSFTQEAVPEEPPEDVLMEQAAARVEECRRVGSRLVVKGQAEVCVLYRGDNQELAAYRTGAALLPAAGRPGPAGGCGRGSPYSVGPRRGPGAPDGKRPRVRHHRHGMCGAVCQAQAADQLYRGPVQSAAGGPGAAAGDRPAGVLAAGDPHPGGSAAAGVRPGRPFAYLTAADCGGVSVVQEGGSPALRCTVRLRVLYLDESGTPVCAERSVEVTAPVSWEPQTVRAACGLPQLQFTGSACRLAVPVTFEACQCRRRPVPAVSAVELQARRRSPSRL